MVINLQVLYIKNLHRKASQDDLHAIFGHWQDGSWPKLTLLTGRMGGQAFANFQSEFMQPDAVLALVPHVTAGVSAASDALAEVNGYLVKDKPLIISYGNSQQPPATSTPCTSVPL